MKKSVSIFLSLVIFIALPGCASRSGTNSKKSSLIKVGFCQTGAESVWRVANTDNMRSTLSEKNGYELIFADGQQQPETQIRAIRNFIQQKVDYIVLAPIVESGWDSVLEEASRAKIPVIIVDRMVKVEDKELYTAYVGSNFLKEGQTAIRWLESVLKQQGREKKPVRIVNIQGTIGSSAQIGRTAALDEGLKNNTNWELVAKESGDFIKPKAYEIMSKILSKTQDIDVVYCENDSEAFGAIKALEEAGLKCSANGGVIVISFDATSEGLYECLSGRISLNVECNPLQGPYVADIIQKLNRRETVDRISYMEETWFDSFTITKEIIEKRVY